MLVAELKGAMPRKASPNTLNLIFYIESTERKPFFGHSSNFRIFRPLNHYRICVCAWGWVCDCMSACSCKCICISMPLCMCVSAYYAEIHAMFILPPLCRLNPESRIEGVGYCPLSGFLGLEKEPSPCVHTWRKSWGAGSPFTNPFHETPSQRNHYHAIMLGESNLCLRI